MPLESLRKRDVKPSLDPASPIPSSLNHMRATTFTLEASDGVSIVVHRWLPDKPLKGVVQIAHGWTEHAARYARVAEALCREAYAVYANDHRGHGRTARTPAELGFFAEDDGWNRCLDDLWRLNQRIRADYPRVPVVVFGHSLGSFMIQQFISEHGDAIAGAVLSGSNGKPLAVARLALLLARFERLRVGSHARSALLHGLVFGSFNRPFEPARTPFDWLSRDPIEVDKFLTDPLCGFRSTVRLYIDVLVALIDVARPSPPGAHPEEASHLHLPRYPGPRREQYGSASPSLSRRWTRRRDLSLLSRWPPRKFERSQSRRSNARSHRLGRWGRRKMGVDPVISSHARREARFEASRCKPARCDASQTGLTREAL